LKPIIIIDSGPLIAVLFAKDRYHSQAVAGFKQLQAEGYRLVLPLPIVFEVYRWLLQQGGAKLAQAVLVAIEQSFEVYAMPSAGYAYAEPELVAITLEKF
jgi:predicted nucleic acid-binding protein